MSDAKAKASALFLKHMEALDAALGGDEKVSPAVLKAAQEFFKENSITVDSLSVATFDELEAALDLDTFDEDDVGPARH